jgi:hypothetical protein
VQDFLEMEIPDSAAAEIRIVEWRPALAVYRSAYLALVEETAEFIKRSDANTRTLNAFGKRWVRNFFKNLKIIRSVLRPAPLSLPLLVTGAGPGLEDVIPMVLENDRQGSLFVLAVSSSVAALEAAKLVPDMVISTDGGLWAAFHLFECLRGHSTFPYPLAAALTATLPSQCASVPILPISDGSLWQTLILKELKIPFIVLPQRGTVSASALDLAFALTKGDIFIAGIDLENRDIRSHARPYSLDRFIEQKAGRLNPAYSQAFRRSSLLKAGGSYDIYASWFEKQLATYPKRLHSLGKNNRVFSSLRTSTEYLSHRSFGSRYRGTEGGFETITLQFTDNPSRKAYGVLEKALQDPAKSIALRGELGPILLGDNTDPSPYELLEALHSLVGFVGGSN